MAYNSAMYNTYGGNPYGTSYGQQQYQQPMQQIPQPSYAQAQPSQGMVWVDGETEAKGKQMPVGVTHFAMWDINEPVIYIKSLNPMGIPNPLQKIHYKMEEMKNNPTGQGGMNLMSGEEEKDGTAQFVRKDELLTMKEEIMQAIREMKSEGTTKRTTTKGE